MVHIRPLHVVPDRSSLPIPLRYFPPSNGLVKVIITLQFFATLHQCLFQFGFAIVSLARMASEVQGVANGRDERSQFNCVYFGVLPEVDAQTLMTYGFLILILVTLGVQRHDGRLGLLRSLKTHSRLKALDEQLIIRQFHEFLFKII